LTGWEKKQKWEGWKWEALELSEFPPFNISARFSRNDRFFHPFVRAFQVEREGPNGSSMKGWPERENSSRLGVMIWVCKGFTSGGFLSAQSKVAVVWL